MGLTSQKERLKINGMTLKQEQNISVTERVLSDSEPAVLLLNKLVASSPVKCVRTFGVALTLKTTTCCSSIAAGMQI